MQPAGDFVAKVAECGRAEAHAESLDPLTYEALRHRLWPTTRRTEQALNWMPSSAVVTDRNDIAITDEIGGTDRPRCAVPRHRRLTWRPLDPGAPTWMTQPGGACSPSGLASMSVMLYSPLVE